MFSSFVSIGIGNSNIWYSREDYKNRNDDNNYIYQCTYSEHCTIEIEVLCENVKGFNGYEVCFNTIEDVKRGSVGFLPILKAVLEIINAEKDELSADYFTFTGATKQHTRIYRNLIRSSAFNAALTKLGWQSVLHQWQFGIVRIEAINKIIDIELQSIIPDYADTMQLLRQVNVHDVEYIQSLAAFAHHKLRQGSITPMTYDAIMARHKG